MVHPGQRHHDHRRAPWQGHLRGGSPETAFRTIPANGVPNSLPGHEPHLGETRPVFRDEHHDLAEATAYTLSVDPGECRTPAQGQERTTLRRRVDGVPFHGDV